MSAASVIVAAQFPSSLGCEIFVTNPGAGYLTYSQLRGVGTENEMSEETIEVPYERYDMFREQHAMFLQCIRGTRAPETTAATGLLVQQMIEGSTVSWQQARPVDFPASTARM